MASFKKWQTDLTILLLAGVTCVALAALAGGQSQAQTTTVTVNSTLDEQDAHPGDGICETAPTVAASPTTIRQATLPGLLSWRAVRLAAT